MLRRKILYVTLTLSLATLLLLLNTINTHVADAYTIKGVSIDSQQSNYFQKHNTLQYYLDYIRSSAVKIKAPWGGTVVLLTPPGVRILSINYCIEKYILFKYKEGLIPKTLDWKPKPIIKQLFIARKSEAPTMIDVLKLINATRLKLNGSGVTVGIVDTGVDFGVKALGIDKIARDSSGRPMLLDADEIGLALTPLNVSIIDKYSRLLDTKGKYVEVYIPLVGFARVSVNYYWRAPVINSTSGVYKFGFFVAYMFPQNYMLDEQLPGIGVLVPVLLVDSKKPGVYDTAYLDLSTTWFLIDGFFYALGLTPKPPSLSMLDFSFANEKPLRMGSGVAAIDVDGDGYNDFSLGVISGYVYDAFGIISSGANTTLSWRNCWEPKASGIYPGIDPRGRYVDFFYDPIGHGTSVASIIAGKNVDYFLPSYNGLTEIPFRGIAPGCKLAAAMALYAGDVVTALKWLSGFDYINHTWVYTGKHKCDVISNSWGLVQWSWLVMASGGGFLPGGDPISKAIDEIVSKTNTTIVFAAGNEGPGESSVAIGGSAKYAITVGASSIFTKPIYDVYGHLLLPQGIPDAIQSWSSRGPLPLGYCKPDLVAPGAFALIPSNTISGLGDGSRAIDIFGGTSMAAPVTAGSIAIIIEKAREEGLKLTPNQIKELLEQSSVDLGYPPEIQGSGLLNLGEALSILEHVRHIKKYEYDVINLRNSKVNGSTSKYISLYYRVKLFYRNTTELKGLKYNFIKIQVPRNTRSGSYIVVVKIKYSGNILKAKPAIVLWLGGWVDENSDSKIQLREFRVVDQGFMSGNIYALYITSKELQELRAKEWMHNNTILLFLYPENNGSLNVTVTASIIYECNISIKIAIESLKPGLWVAFENEGLWSKPVVLIKTLKLSKESVRISFNVTSTMQALSYGEGDTYYIWLSTTGINDVAGYVVNVSEYCNLYIAYKNYKLMNNLSSIRYVLASNPAIYIPSGYGIHPLQEPKYSYNYIVLPADSSIGNEIIAVEVIDSNGTINLEIAPITYSIKFNGYYLIIKLKSPKPLGLVENCLTNTYVYDCTGNITLKIPVFENTGKLYVKLLSIYSKRMLSKPQGLEYTTITFGGKPVSILVRIPLYLNVLS